MEEEKNNELVTYEDNNLPAGVEGENSDGLGFGAGVVIGGGLALAAIGVFKLFKKLKTNRTTKKEPKDENIIDGEGVEVNRKEEEQKKEEPKNNNRKNK